MTREHIVAKADFWSKAFLASSFAFTPCQIITLWLIKTPAIYFSIIGVLLCVLLFIAFKYFRTTNAKWAMYETKNREERIAALFSKP